MKNITVIILLMTIFISACGRDYRKGLIGKWDAGKATENSRIILTFRNDGSTTVQIKNYSVEGRYLLNGNKLKLTYKDLKLDYKIQKLTDKHCSIAINNLRFKWTRLK